MDSIKINTGIIRLEVDRDGEKNVIAFNPNDVVFAEKAYNLFKKFGEKQKEFDEKVKELEQLDSEDVLDERFKLKLTMYSVQEQAKRYSVTQLRLICSGSFLTAYFRTYSVQGLKDSENISETKTAE